MTLPWPAFEKRLRRLLRAELASKPPLRKQVRKARKPKPVTSQAFRLRLLFAFLTLVVFIAFVKNVRNLEFALAIISLWTAGAAFRKAQQWFQIFYGSDDLAPLNLLPVSDEQIFRYQSRKYASQFGWIFLEVTLLYFAVALLQEQWNPFFYLAPVVALAFTGLIFSLSLHFVVFLHTLPLGAIATALRGSAFLFLIFGAQIQSFIPYLVQFSYWFFPTGWLNYALMQSLFRQDWITALLLFPVGAIIYAGLYSWHRLRAFYNLDAFELMPHPGMFDGSHMATRGATEIQDAIGERSFLRTLDWQGAGWLEKWISQSLRGRDRMVLDFLVAENPGWTRSLKNALWIFAFALGVVYLFGQLGGFLVFAPAYLVAVAALPLFGGEWRGLQVLPGSGVFLPPHAVYPISLQEMTRVMLRVNIFRTIIAAPLLLTFGVLAAWKLGDPLLMGWRITSKILGLFLALQPLIVLIPLSRGAHYTSPRAWRHLLFNVPILLAIALLSFAFFFASHPLHTFLLLASVCLLCALLHAFHRRAFNRGAVDLLRTEASSSN